MKLTKRQKEMLATLVNLEGKGRLYHDLLITPRSYWQYAGPMHTSTTARVARQLEEKGLVRILRDSHQETWVEITEEGRSVLKEAPDESLRKVD